jgi:hypothetical protein
MSSQLTTGIPWVDRALAIIAGAITLCSFLSHYIPPTSVLGKLVSYIALNGGKLLVKQDPASLPAPKGFARVGALLALCALTLCAACVAGWQAAVKAAPACYGLTAANVSTIVSEGKAIALDAAQCATIAGCPAAVEAALGTYLANQALDDQAYDCVTEAIKLEIKYPHGGEAPYTPDAGPEEAPSALQAAVAMSAQQITALEGIESLQAHVRAARAPLKH